MRLLAPVIPAGKPLPSKTSGRIEACTRERDESREIVEQHAGRTRRRRWPPLRAHRRRGGCAVPVVETPRGSAHAGGRGDVAGVGAARRSGAAGSARAHGSADGRSSAADGGRSGSSTGSADAATSTAAGRTADAAAGSGSPAARPGSTAARRGCRPQRERPPGHGGRRRQRRADVRTAARSDARRPLGRARTLRDLIHGPVRTPGRGRLLPGVPAGCGRRALR